MYRLCSVDTVSPLTPLSSLPFSASVMVLASRLQVATRSLSSHVVQLDGRLRLTSMSNCAVAVRFVCFCVFERVSRVSRPSALVRHLSGESYQSAAPTFTGKATNNAAHPITGVDEGAFSFNRMLAANQKAWNAAHYPSTPIPATYAAITKATNYMMDVVWLVAYVGMGAAMSTGIWAPVSALNSTAQHNTTRGSGGRHRMCITAAHVCYTSSLCSLTLHCTAHADASDPPHTPPL